MADGMITGGNTGLSGLPHFHVAVTKEKQPGSFHLIFITVKLLPGCFIKPGQ